jgi:hypothetical protein
MMPHYAAAPRARGGHSLRTTAQLLTRATLEARAELRGALPGLRMHKHHCTAQSEEEIY